MKQKVADCLSKIAPFFVRIKLINIYARSISLDLSLFVFLISSIKEHDALQLCAGRYSRG